MKRSPVFACIVLCALFMMLFSSSMLAETPLSPEVVALVQAAFPSHRILLSDQCGRTAAAVLSDGQTQVLCLAEQTDGDWALTVSNPTAFDPDRAISSLKLNADDSLCWTYALDGFLTETHHAVCTAEQWYFQGIAYTEVDENGYVSESHCQYDKGRLLYATYLFDETERILSANVYMPVPAQWLYAIVPLSAYDQARFPIPNRNYTHSWLPEEATALAAAELFPGTTYLGGCASQHDLQFFLQMPNGERRISSCWLNQEDEWNTVLSTPLPEGTMYGCENFSSSLVIGDLLVNIGPVDAATCGVCFIYDGNHDTMGTRMFSLGKNWITGESPNGYGNRFGDHPWCDITTLDWTSLPHTLEEAMAALDTTAWAIVNNPNPEDRLHLRVKPDREAKSLGKYYNGTPVRILAQKGNWVHVDIFGVQGFMMRDYLAFGSAGHDVKAAFPSRISLENQTDHFVYAAPEAVDPIANYRYTGMLLVLGLVGDDWYHAWFPEENLAGYVLQRDWWEGNG